MATTINGDGEISGTGSTPTLTLTDSDGTNDIATFEGVAGAARITVRDGNADGEVIFRKYDGTTYDETARITNTGRLGIGTSTPGAPLDVFAATGTYFKGGSDHVDRQLLITSSTTTNAGDTHTIRAPSSTGNLAFTTQSAESFRVDKDGRLQIGKTASALGTAGITLEKSGVGWFTMNGSYTLGLNRLSDDGKLIAFFQDTAQEGNISVSGGTVSYNGGHLSRWSQLAGGAERIEILRGSVLSNLDEMCEWGKEDNEQLNRMKVSDVEGDVNVSGVFQSWDDEDDTYTNDFYCAMTGDFVIRIAKGTTVARGDLLMSAGDGTAKPQDDDIVRSKTIAKVTSTTVSTTYADGSFCVPCVLMAC